MAKKRKTNPFKVPMKECTNLYSHKDLKITVEKLQRHWQRKENKTNPNKPRTVTLTWSTKELNRIIDGMLKGNIK